VDREYYEQLIFKRDLVVVVDDMRKDKYNVLTFTKGSRTLVYFLKIALINISIECLKFFKLKSHKIHTNKFQSLSITQLLSSFLLVIISFFKIIATLK
jgi:hypothetical protein